MLLHLTSPAEKGLSIMNDMSAINLKKIMISHFDTNKILIPSDQH